jgi:hypothetical protein
LNAVASGEKEYHNTQMKSFNQLPRIWKIMGGILIVLILGYVLYAIVPAMIAASLPAPTSTPTQTMTPSPTSTSSPTITPTSTPDLTKIALETLVFELEQTQNAQLTSAALTPTSTPPPTNAPNRRATETPQGTPAPGLPFTVTEFTSPVKAGKNATVTIETTPGAFCYLTYWTPSGRLSSADGLGGKTADANGVCSWKWLITDKEPPGNGTVAIGVNGGGQSFVIVITE